MDGNARYVPADKEFLQGLNLLQMQGSFIVKKEESLSGFSQRGFLLKLNPLFVQYVSTAQPYFS
jgi:hypothetical protein